MRMRLTATAVTAAALTLAGCGGSSSPQQVHNAPGHAHQVDEKSAGQSVSAHVGDTIVVTLHSTYWQLGHPAGGVLESSGAPVVAKGHRCPPVPGSGCGTVRETYTVAAAGKATISAHRDSCGEAMRCTGSLGDWSVKVTAS